MIFPFYFSSYYRCFIGFRKIEGVCTGINIAYDYEKAVFYEWITLVNNFINACLCE